MKQLRVTVNGKTYDVQVEELGSTPAYNSSSAPSAPAPKTAPVAAPKAAASGQAVGDDVMNSPMPGTILDVKVAVGQKVKAGDALLILEAMKMENEIAAPKDATVAAVHVSKGDNVEAGAALVSFS